MSGSFLRRIARRALPQPARRALGSAWVRTSGAVTATRLRIVCAAAARRPRTPREVVFVSDMPRSREAKLAYGLGKIGWKAILLRRDEPDFDASQYFAATHRYTHPSEAVALAARYAPVAYHVFSCWEFEVAEAMVRYRPGTIVFDDYDVFAGVMRESSVQKNLPGALQRERYCLEQADGLCCRSLETQAAKRRHGYRYRGPRLLLLDGCWGQTSPRERCFDDDEFHVAYCGNLPKPDGSCRDYLQGLATDLSARHVHLHIYPSPTRWRRMRDEPGWDALEEACPSIHLHAPVPSDRIGDVLSQYDTALFDVEMFADHRDEWYAPAKYVYATANKLFDYFDAGVPVVLRSTRFQHFLLRRAKAGVILGESQGLADAVARLSGPEWTALRENARRAGRQHGIVRQAPRLAAFYESLSSSRSERAAGPQSERSRDPRRQEVCER